MRCTLGRHGRRVPEALGCFVFRDERLFSRMNTHGERWVQQLPVAKMSTMFPIGIYDSIRFMVRLEINGCAMSTAFVSRASTRFSYVIRRRARDICSPSSGVRMNKQDLKEPCKYVASSSSSSLSSGCCLGGGCRRREKMFD